MIIITAKEMRNDIQALLYRIRKISDFVLKLPPNSYDIDEDTVVDIYYVTESLGLVKQRTCGLLEVEYDFSEPNLHNEYIAAVKYINRQVKYLQRNLFKQAISDEKLHNAWCLIESAESLLYESVLRFIKGTNRRKLYALFD